MPEIEITFGGLRSLEYDERVDVDHALLCDDCHVDYGGVQPRNGYRSVFSTLAANSPIKLTGTLTTANLLTYNDGINPAHTYGLLNGDLLAVYINNRGDLGAPFEYGATTKPQGIGGPGGNFNPVVNADGTVPVSSGTYGLLRSSTSTAAGAPIQASVQAKQEVITIGTSVLEAYGVWNGTGWLHGGAWAATAFTVNRATSGTLTATSYANSGGINIVQVATIDVNAPRRVSFTVTVTNNTGSPITNMQYARVVNPNFGNATLATTQFLGEALDPTLFAITAQYPFGVGQAYNLALGVASDGNQVGATIFASSVTTENGLFNNLNAQLASASRVILGSGTNASYYVSSTLTATTANYQTDTAFINGVNFDNSSDDALVLLSAAATIASGGSFSFAFSYDAYARGDSMTVVNSGLPQGVWRFRPGSVGRTVVVRGGYIWEVVDPASETAQVATAIQPVGAILFQSSANISGAQLGKYLYLASDSPLDTWQRVKPDFTMESIASLHPGATPTVSYSSLVVKQFNPAGVTIANTTSNTTLSTVFTDWINASATNTTNNLTIDITNGAGGTANWNGYGWLAVMITPSTGNSTNNTVNILVSTYSSSGFESLGNITDTPGPDSPGILYVPLTGLTASTRGAVRYLQFSANKISNYEVYGYMLVPTAPAIGIQQYFLDTYSSTSQQTSGLYPPLKTDGTGGISVSYAQAGITIPSFHLVVGNESSFSDRGTLSLDPNVLVTVPNRFYNASAPTAFPTRDQFSAIPTFTGTSPAGSYDTLRLWRLTSTGIRLVKSITQTPSAGYAITDDQGQYTLTQQLYIPGGPPPACTTMWACGGRVLAGGDPANPARFYVSSYLAFGSNTDPFPQFPAVPTLITDGWAADLAPTSAEQILWGGEGDKQSYILTNEACYLLASTDAPLYGPPPFFEVWKRGVISRRGAVWVEDTLFWAAHDGVYMAKNRSFGGELTKTLNRLYRTWLLPDATTVLGYQDRRLYIQRGTRQLRYDFNTDTWSRHTLPNVFSHSAGWRDPVGTVQQLWFFGSDGNLYRWQPGTYWGDANRATSDAGTPIVNWTYSTGYDTRTIRSMTDGYGDFNTRVARVWTESDGPLTVTIFKDGGNSGSRAKMVAAGMHEVAMAPDLKSYVFRVQYSGANSVRLLRGLWERVKVSAKGG